MSAQILFFEWRNAVTETIKSLNTNSTDLSNVFLSQQIAQITQRLSLLNAKALLNRLISVIS